MLKHNESAIASIEVLPMFTIFMIREAVPIPIPGSTVRSVASIQFRHNGSCLYRSIASHAGNAHGESAMSSIWAGNGLAKLKNDTETVTDIDEKVIHYRDIDVL